jgi:hypothetical protein
MVWQNEKTSSYKKISWFANLDLEQWFPDAKQGGFRSGIDFWTEATV